MKAIKDNVTIAQHQESVVDVAGIKVKGGRFNNIKSRGNVKIVIIHKPSEGTHISLCSTEKVKYNDRIKIEGIPICGLLYGFKALTSNLWSEIGIYDVRDGTFIKRSILGFIAEWIFAEEVTCVTTDPVKNHIIVGTCSRDVYVFTDQLNYSHMIKLPDVIRESCDITVHRGSLLVCGNFFERQHMQSPWRNHGVN
ncbi:hypothetical protein BSL78_17253 [Apostichopus japonicus]|uniref:Uncharacterized protein n=1 Tax=Stichopus japonicus TaxID=307972 RepID=A0A2G8KCY4_STIJA|nr:hypothetical protein BSL78_17253 [Apostichopus japonicus]